MKKIIILAAAVLLNVAAQAGPYPEITIDQLKSAMTANAVTLLDVNGTQSWKEGHIPGAIDYTKSQASLAKVLPPDKNALIVAYCGGPSCGAYARAAKAAKDLGYTNVKHLVAGISGWKSAGEKTSSGSEPPRWSPSALTVHCAGV
jgi:rhodanese-related sulfurtransferase